MIRVAFDIDDTIWKVYRESPECDKMPQSCVRTKTGYCDFHKPKLHQAPDYDLIQVLRWFYDNGDRVYIWSAGGVDYAETIVKKLGLTKLVTVISKRSGEDMDIVFDDQDTKLGKVDVRVNRIINSEHA